MHFGWAKQLIHPKVMFLIHYGGPHLVNLYELIFKSVTLLATGHLYYTTVADFQYLTHLAVNTRLELWHVRSPTTLAIRCENYCSRR